jgi:hypothetical protein
MQMEIVEQANKPKPLKKAEPKGSDDLIKEARNHKYVENFIYKIKQKELDKNFNNSKFKNLKTTTQKN